MVENSLFAERGALSSALPETSITGAQSKAGLSGSFFADAGLRAAFQDKGDLSAAQSSSGEHLIADNPFAPTKGGMDKSVPLLAPELRQQLEGADTLEFSTPIDNLASGSKADFRLVQGTDGQLRLEPLSAGDPLADGKLNIEIDPENKSLVEAIKSADRNLKEYIREMICYWQKNHPAKPYPGWWQDILDSQPNIPDNPRPVPIERTPPQFRPPERSLPEPPAAPSQGWQPDYRGGGGRGYGGGYGSGGGGAAAPSDGSYYRGRGRGSSPDYSVPGDVPVINDSNGFIDRLVKTIMKNEGAMNSDGSPKFEAYNPDDNGGISVGLRQWHAGGALPELLNAWKDKNPEKFQDYFQGYSPAQINGMSSKEFASHPELVQGMKSALSDKEYQGVQLQLINDWVKREVKMGMDMGLTGEKELATFVDIANQYGQSRANEAAHIGKAGGDQAEQMNASVRGGKYAERFALIDSNFSTQTAQLEPKVPQAGEFGQRLANAVKVWDEKMPGTGYCATAVQRALADVGLKEFVGSGNAWDMLGPLQRSGKFVQVPESQAAVGDLILRPPSSNPNDDSVYGDISVVTARKGNTIIQTNDATYEYERNNPRYDNKAVFLRYVGDQGRENSTLVAKSDTSDVQAKKKA